MRGRDIEAHIVSAIGGALVVHMVWWGVHENHLRHDADAKLKGAIQVIDVERKQADVTATVGTEVAAKVDKIQYRTRKVIQYVPQVLPLDVVERYPLSNGFVRVHDAAILSEIPAPASELDGSPSDIGADQALSTIVGNIGTCQAIEVQLIGLQTWIKQQQALSESTIK